MTGLAGAALLAAIGGFEVSRATAPVIPSHVVVEVRLSGHATVETRHSVRGVPSSFRLNVDGATFDVRMPTGFEHHVKE